MICEVCDDIRRIAKDSHEKACLQAGARTDQFCRIAANHFDFVREYLDCYSKQYTRFYYQSYDEVYQIAYNAIVYNLFDYKDNPTCTMHAHP